MLKPPIILIGNVRSGTTMLQRLFSLHPEVTSWFEPRTVWNYANPTKKWDRLNESDATPKVIKYIRKRFLQYQKEHDGLRVMEKTPNNVVRISYVHKIFPESKLLYVVRDPLAQLSSSELKWQRVVDWNDRRHALYRIKQTPKTQLHFYAIRFLRQFIRAKILKKKHPRIFGVRYKEIYNDKKYLTSEQIIAKQWVYCSRQAEQDLSKLDKKIIYKIRYEDFVADPVYQFENILNHFDLSLPPIIAETISSRVDPNRQDKWKRLDPKILELCTPILEEEMQKHGYKIPKAFETS